MAAEVKSNIAQLGEEKEKSVQSRSHWQRALARLRNDRLTLLAMGVMLVSAIGPFVFFKRKGGL